MSRLEELIAELCPNGVEYKFIWQVTIWDKKFNSVDRYKQPYVINYPYLLAKELFDLEQENGNVFLLSTGEKVGFTTEELAGDYLCEGEVVTIPWGKSRPVSEVMKYYNGKFVTADNRIVTSANRKILSNKYLFYWMTSEGKQIDTFYRGSGIKPPSMKDILDMRIPVPPLPVQEEIVRILDNFAELTAELTKRKQQYQYYRDKLFKNSISSKSYKLMDLCGTITTGRLNANAMVENGKYPFFTCDANPYKIDTYAFDTTAILISGNGSQIGHLNFYSGKFNAYQRTYVLYDFFKVSPRYLFLYLKSYVREYILKYAKKGSVPYITLPMLQNFLVPVPPQEEQERIVTILDRFDALCNDLTSGLPAEIEARKKQYEYYRDKLLTFKEAV